MSNYEEHIETIKQVKRYIERKDYEGLTIYIKKREKEISKTKNKESDYIDKLVDELN